MNTIAKRRDNTAVVAACAAAALLLMAMLVTRSVSVSIPSAYRFAAVESHSEATQTWSADSTWTTKGGWQ